MGDDFKTDKMEFAKHWVMRGLDTMEKYLSKTSGKYSFGDQVTAADVFLYPQASASEARWKADLSKYKNIHRVMQNLRAKKEFVDAEPQNQPDFEK